MRWFTLLLLCALCMGFEWPGRVDHLVRELKQGDVEARKLAVRQLGQHPASLSETALLTALEDDDVGVRIEAARAAGHAGIIKATPILTDWLHDSDVALRRAAVVGLGQLGEVRALSDLVRALGDASTEVRAAAVIALRSLHSPEAVAPLLGRLADADLGVRGHAIDALAVLRDERAVVPLLTQLLDPSTDLASRAASALGAIGDARAIPTLIQALQGRPVEVRIASAAALGRLRAVSAIRALELAASDPDPRLARAAIDALGRIDDPAARTALIAKLGSVTLGEAAITALVEHAQRISLKLDNAVERTQLLEALAASAQPAATAGGEAAAIAGARTLVRIGAFMPIDAVLEKLATRVRAAPSELALPLLDALATSDAEPARLTLLERLGGAPDEQRVRLIDALERQLSRGEPDGRAADPILERMTKAPMAEQGRLVSLLGLTGAERIASAVVPFLTASQPELRAAAARALGQAHAHAQAAQVLPLLDDADPNVRMQAARALRAIGDATIADGLLDKLDTVQAREAPDRQALLIALGGALDRLQQQRALPEATAQRAFATLTKLWTDPDQSIADRALEALSTWGPKPALSFLGLALRTPSSRRRAVVTTALARLGTDEKARVALRYVLDQGGERSAVAALSALAEVGDERDLGALVRTARRKHWPLPAAATYALARMTLRGVLKPHVAKRALCQLGRSRQPYIRANVAAALAGIGASACEDGGPDPLRWLSRAAAPAVRFAAARWIRAAVATDHMDEPSARAALEECARVDVDANVRAACATAPSAPRRTALHVQALDVGASSALADRLVALRITDGSVFLGYGDHNGTVYLPNAAVGATTLEDPASTPLEPRD